MTSDLMMPDDIKSHEKSFCVLREYKNERQREKRRKKARLWGGGEIERRKWLLWQTKVS